MVENISEKILKKIQWRLKRTAREISLTSNKFYKNVNFNKAYALFGLMRLEQSFKSAIILVNKNYAFEANLICRLIIEQLSWIYVVDNSKEEDLKNVKATKCISKYKEAFYLTGRVYGLLSKISHFDFEPLNNYVFPNKDEPGMIIPKNFPEERLNISLTLFILVELYNFNYEYIFRNELSKFKNLEFHSEDKIVFKHNSNDAKLIEHIAKVLSKKA